MNPQKKRRFSVWIFGAVCTGVLSVALLFFSNIVLWAELPDAGFIYRSATGIHTVGGVRSKGIQAGLKPGDRILEINGKKFATIEERRKAENKEIGKENLYLVERKGERFEVTIPNVRLGFKASFVRHGFTFLTGLMYVLIGVLVFLMKPHRQSSWAFFANSVCLGLVLLFLMKGGKFSPSFLGTVHLWIWSFAPATVFHLMVMFPEKRKWVGAHPGILYLPYAASLVIFIGTRSSSAEMFSIPRTWYLATLFYLVATLLMFLISCIQLWVRSASEITRLRSKYVLLGALVASSVPILDLTTSAVFHMFVVPGFNYYLPFLVFFPLCVAYSIVKHNLFDIQRAVRRTFGYVLVTVSVALLYTLLMVIPAVTFGKEGFSDYPGMAIAAILIIVFVFNLFRQRVQKVVDRVFYRMEYDYHEVMEKIGQSMRTSMMLDQIVSRMTDIVFNSLFIEKGYVMLKTKDEKTFVSVLKEEPSVTLPAQDDFIRLVTVKKKGITRYDIEEDPALQENKKNYENTFNKLEAVLILPILFEDRLFGLLVLGEKKSGKFYKREDILLLNILSNQAAVAMENARLQQSRLEALELSKKELEALNKAKSKTLHLLSHELKTPLSVISGTVKTLMHKSDLQNDPQKRGRAFQRLEDNVNRLYDIQEVTDRIIRSHREAESHMVEETSKKASREPLAVIDLKPFAEKLLASVRTKAIHRELSFELRGPTDLKVRMNPVILEDATEALLRNAVENTPDEGLIRILLEAGEEKVFFKVKDFGVGITPENRKHLFQAFYHTRESDQYATRRPYDFDAGGKGLALFRIRSYAEQYEFDFFFNSKRCSFIPDDRDSCPGRISACPHCNSLRDCLTSGGSTFWLVFTQV